MNVPNFLTFLRLFLIIPIFILLVLSHYYIGYIIGIILYFIACISDFFDGYIARKFKQTSITGKIFDPISDKILTTTLFVVLLAKNFLSPWSIVAILLMLIRDILILGVRSYSKETSLNLPVSYLAQWKSCAQMIAIGFILVEKIINPYTFHIGEIILLISFILSYISIYSYFTNFFQLYKTSLFKYEPQKIDKKNKQL